MIPDPYQEEWCEGCERWNKIHQDIPGAILRPTTYTELLCPRCSSRSPQTEAERLRAKDRISLLDDLLESLTRSGR